MVTMNSVGMLEYALPADPFSPTLTTRDGIPVQPIVFGDPSRQLLLSVKLQITRHRLVDPHPAKSVTRYPLDSDQGGGTESEIRASIDGCSRI